MSTAPRPRLLKLSGEALKGTADGTALADGAPGDVIQARREHDRKLVEARVVGDGRAVVNFR